MFEPYVLNSDGEPELCCDLAYWASWFARTNRDLARDEVDGVYVATIFAGMNQGSTERPLLWETVIFGGTLDRYCERHESHASALLGHARCIALVLTTQRRARAVNV